MGILDFMDLATQDLSGGLIILILITLIWKLIWYGLAIYKSVHKKQKRWFVVLFVSAFVLNDLGILAMIYLVLNKKKINSKKPIKKVSKKKK